MNGKRSRPVRRGADGKGVLRHYLVGCLPYNLAQLAGSFLGQSKRLWSYQLWHEAQASCATGGRETGTRYVLCFGIKR